MNSNFERLRLDGCELTRFSHIYIIYKPNDNIIFMLVLNKKNIFISAIKIDITTV